MTVGLPGTGIGGLFYVLSGLLMPLRSIWRRRRGVPVPHGGRIVLRQTSLAALVVAAIWATGWMIGAVLRLVPALTSAVKVLESTGGRGLDGNVIAASAVLLGIGTLLVVLLVVEVAGIMARRGRRARPPVERVTPRALIFRR